MVKYDRSKFVFSETFNNSTGKTSGSGFIGVVLGMIAGAGIVAGTVGYFFEIPNTLEYLGVILKLVAAATILLGVRRLSGDFNSEKIADADATVTETFIKADIAEVKAVDIAEVKAVKAADVAVTLAEVKAEKAVDLAEKTAEKALDVKDENKG